MEDRIIGQALIKIILVMALCKMGKSSSIRKKGLRAFIFFEKAKQIVPVSHRKKEYVKCQKNSIIPDSHRRK